MVDISSGFNVEVGWCGEASYAPAAAATVAALDGTNALSMFFDSLGIVTDCTLTPTVERYHGYGTGSQTRISDGILKEGYELSVTVLWQDDASRGCIHRFLEAHEDGTYESYLIRVMAIPAGSAVEEYAYLIGCVLRNVSIKISVGDVVGITLTFVVKQVDSDDWQTLVGNDYTYVLNDLHVGAISVGLQGDITADITTDDTTLEVQSSDAADDGDYVLVIGRDTDNSTWINEFIGPLNNAGGFVAGAENWSGAVGPTFNIVGAILMSTNSHITCVPQTATGNITIRENAGANPTVITIAAASQSMGMIMCDPDKPQNGARVGDEVIYAVGDSACANYVVMIGTDTTDTVFTEEILMNGATPVASATAFRTVRYIAVGDLAAADSVRIYGSIHSDPTMYHECDITLPAELIDIGNELQDFNLDEAYNPAEIMNFEDSTLKLAGDSLSEETTFGGSYYGDDTSMGVNAVLSRLVLAAGTGDLIVKIGSYWEYNVTAASYDNMSFPFKEKELIILIFDGHANYMSLDEQ